MPEDRRPGKNVSSDAQFGPVHLFHGANQGRYPYCNSLYLEGPGILIDPASDRDRLAELRDGPGVSEVWLSHWHEDHFAHLDLFDDIPFRITELDAEALWDPEVMIAWSGLDRAELRENWRQLIVEQFNYRPRRPASFLVPGETISFDALTVDLVHTPGHTPGHLALFFREPRLLFTGDYDLTNFGPWYGDENADIDLTIAAVNKLREIEAKTWITSHEYGLFTEQPGELWDRYLAVIGRREQQLLDFLSEPRTLDEIASQWIAYGKPHEPMHFYEFGERALMRKHLERLAARGEVVAEHGRYRKNGGST